MHIHNINEEESKRSNVFRITCWSYVDRSTVIRVLYLSAAASRFSASLKLMTFQIAFRYCTKKTSVRSSC